MAKRFDTILPVRLQESSTRQLGLVVLQESLVKAALQTPESWEQGPDVMITRAIDYELNRRKA